MSSPNEVSNPTGDLSGNDSGTKEFIYKDDQSPGLKKASTKIDLIDQKYAAEKNDDQTNGGWVNLAVHCYTQK